MGLPVLPTPSGENVYKFLVTLSIALIAFNLLYPREKSLEVNQLKSEIEYQIDLLNLKIEPVSIQKTKLEKDFGILDSIKRKTGEYPSVMLGEYKERYNKFSKDIDELNINRAELDHKERLKANLNNQLNYYNSVSYWTFVPAIISFAVFLFLWIRDHIKSKKD